MCKATLFPILVGSVLACTALEVDTVAWKLRFYDFVFHLVSRVPLARYLREAWFVDVRACRRRQQVGLAGHESTPQLLVLQRRSVLEKSNNHTSNVELLFR